MYSPYNYPVRSKKFPKEIPMYVEVAKGSRCKYEYNHKTGFITLDRILHSAVFYPYNYGFVPQTLCDDGDPLDILVMSNEALVPGSIVNVKPVCYMVMEDEKGMDEKLLGVIANDPNFSHISSLESVPIHQLKEISQFFETYKALEKNKWVKVGDWKDTQETLNLIKTTNNNYHENVGENI